MIKSVPKCKDCKWYRNNKIGQPECKKFEMKVNNDKKYYEFTFICRNNDDLCGENGYYFSEKSKKYGINGYNPEPLNESLNEPLNDFRNNQVVCNGAYCLIDD